MKLETGLPSYDRPPLSEVALSIQFNALAGFGYVHIGPLWTRFRDKFPDVEYQPPLQATFETFGVNPIAPQLPHLQIMQMPEMPRIWLLAKNEIIQFQRDRFIHNWRKIGDGDAYPRYEAVRARFLEELSILQAFANENDLGQLVPNQCELTYVNVIKIADASDPDPTAKIFKCWNDVGVEIWGPPEDVALSMRYRILGKDGEPIGRVSVQSASGYGADGARVIQLNLVGRGRPDEPTFEGAVAFLDIARVKIVEGFTALTTEKMHEAWGRRT